jgi:hypothetical protein
MFLKILVAPGPYRGSKLRREPRRQRTARLGPDCARKGRTHLSILEDEPFVPFSRFSRSAWAETGKSAHNHREMKSKNRRGIPLIVCLLIAVAAVLPASEMPQYTMSGEMKFPDQYRKWVYLTSGFDMSYSASMRMDGAHSFDNVFVNPEAYESFLISGSWPDHTMLVLEVRQGQGRGSINRAGNYQGDRTAVEVHVKDEARFAGKWAFFGFEGSGTAANSARMIPASADCYSCHAQHGAVDTTFVQFYPTLLPLASAKGTLSASYLKEMRASQ